MEKSKKIVLFDIDYTLFDTAAYRKTLYPHLAKLVDVPLSDFLQVAAETEKEMKQTFGHFSPDAFLEVLVKLSHKKVTLVELEKVFWDEKVYEDVLGTHAISVLEELNKMGIITGLFSTGEQRHQLAKIRALLSFLPTKHHHVFPNKLSSLEHVLDNYQSYRVYMVDDLPEVLAKAKSLNQSVVTILKKTDRSLEETELTKLYQPDFIISHLAEIIEIVTN